MQELQSPQTFSDLTPEHILRAAEHATGLGFTGLVAPLPSYINRVYELQDMDGRRHIIKFYRPARWSKAALEDEHRFLLDCAAAELPVVAPATLRKGGTLEETGPIFFALFQKRAGRELDITHDRDWEQLGRLIARLHNVAAADKAAHRLYLHPDKTLARDGEELLRGCIPAAMREDFQSLIEQLKDISRPLFEKETLIRLHGDLHRKNILHRPGEGLLLIDFDDMMTGPAMQDLWLLLPDRLEKCRREAGLLMEGYRTFRDLAHSSTELTEPLRAMRQIYFLAWCHRQKNDTRFSATFPDWGSESFWRQELKDLKSQIERIQPRSTRPAFHFIADL
ncbi:Ser/Thr protein kinase RdoA (MazF antagonist) [Desulfobotulus alkaliphilus]|uniref:Stress response kinase A n=1 Tax=Desulfobotulus alkaliphilus TaxID=622671 RepID=A0A562RGD9_9BACT|nr:serine/threonine protein kinase [Desulfobotulus alkaliphilus]TWI68149.1 Ser/Thr protein kinase RdoA (MazF antagonist) [Desulfobotulus alkaliphilus]